MISSNARGESIGMYEQLNPAALSRSNAFPATIRQRIEGITSYLSMAFLKSDKFISVFSSKKLMYLSTVSPQFSRRCSSSR